MLISATGNLGDLGDRGADRNRPAVIDLRDDAAPRTWTHAELDAAADAVARALAERGFARGERVAILSANRAEYLAAYFGIMRAGLVAVPVNFRFPPETIAYVCRDAGARLIFCDPERRPLCPPDLPVVEFGPAVRRLPRPRALRHRAAGPRRDRHVPLHLRFHRQAEGRTAQP